MIKLLNKFYADFQLKAAVKEFLIEKIKEKAIKQAFAGEDTSGIKEAKQIIDSAFRDLDNMFTDKKKRKPQSFK